MLRELVYSDVWGRPWSPRQANFICGGRVANENMKRKSELGREQESDEFCTSFHYGAWERVLFGCHLGCYLFRISLFMWRTMMIPAEVVRLAGGCKREVNAVERS